MRCVPGRHTNPGQQSRSQINWGNRRLSRGAISPSRNAWDVSTVWGSAYDADGDNVVWGTFETDGDNVVWGTFVTDGDNVVWGTACGGDDCGDNVVWGTFDVGDNVVWGTFTDGDNVVWGTSRENDPGVWASNDEVEAVQWDLSNEGVVIDDPATFELLFETEPPPITDLTVVTLIGSGPGI